MASNTVKNQISFQEYKQWVSDSYTELEPQDLKPVEIIIIRDHLHSGLKEHIYFTGTCNPDGKNWNGKMSIVQVKDMKLNIFEFHGKILRQKNYKELLHDEHGRFVEYRLITTPKGVPVYRADSFLPRTDTGLCLDETYVTRNDVEWTATNRSVAASSAETAQALAKHKITLCFEKKEIVGASYEGMQATQGFGVHTPRLPHAVNDD